MTAEKMMEYLYELPAQFRAGLEMDFSLARAHKKEYENVVVSGLGGSAIGGDILRTYALQKAAVPILVNRDYGCPAFVNDKTLFLAVSYSGNTEETLSSFEEAHRKGARIICITSGGKLEKMAAENNDPVVKVPGGLVPRAATGYLFAPLALLMEHLGILTGISGEIEETAAVLEEMRNKLNPGVSPADNPAMKIARKIKGSIPVIWGTAGISEAAALRWKAQINENAKSPAYYNVFPELNHNEIVGFETPASLLPNLSIIILRDRFDNERVKKRIEISSGIIRERVKNLIEVESRGNSWLARFYSLTYTGDYASVYLALEYGLNPTPVAVIDYLKNELAK